MLEFIKHLAGGYGYLGILVLMFLESTVLIVPSELIMGVAGYLAYKGVLNLFIATFFASLGNILGSTVLYFLSKFGRTHLLLKYGGKKVEVGIKRGELLFKKYGNWAILMAQFIPGVRAVISIPAGTLNMAYIPFVLATFIGAFIWCGVLGLGAYLLGQNWILLKNYFREYEIIIFGILVVSFLILVLKILWGFLVKNKK